MAKEKKVKVDDFVLENDIKVRRVIEGMVTREGKLEGGLGAAADPALVRAHYDKIGGLITKGGRKVKSGSFWDFEKKQPRENPKVIFEHRTGSGELFEYQGDNEPVEVVAEKATRARKEKADKAAKDED